MSDQFKQAAEKAAEEKKPPHIVITNPSKPWSTCVMDLECKDCGVALCKNCKPKHVCSEWLKSGYQAADEIAKIYYQHDEPVVPQCEINLVDSIIAKHFADLASTYAKLVELAGVTKWMVDFDTNLSAGRNHLLDFDMLKVKMRRRDELLSDPQVQAAIGGKDETK